MMMTNPLISSYIECMMHSLPSHPLFFCSYLSYLFPLPLSLPSSLPPYSLHLHIIALGVPVVAVANIELTGPRKAHANFAIFSPDFSTLFMECMLLRDSPLCMGSS